METLEIKDITLEYEEERIKHIREVIVDLDGNPFRFNRVLHGPSNYYFRINSRQYKLIYLMKFVTLDGVVQEIKIGYQPHYDYTHRPDLIGGRIVDHEDVDLKIYRFFEKYAKDLFDGKDIKDIIKNDKENILNYKSNDNLNKTFQKSLFKKICKRI